MKDKSQNDEIVQAASDAGVESRRRLLKGIVASAPVVASVASRPVLAARNCSESGQLSGNASGTGPECGGEGCTPGFWKNHTGLWHYDYPTSAVFDTVFGVAIFGNTATLYEVVWNQVEPTGSDVNCVQNTQHPNNPHKLVKALGRHAVAALQNAATSVSYDLTVGQVVASVQSAIVSNCGDVKTTKNTLKDLNQQGCPF